jgi:RNA polymerase sigma-70 factor (ECF subfamily)
MKLPRAEFERLAVEQIDMLYRMARRLSRNVAGAEDLVQETYLRAFKARESFNLQAFGIRPWLLRILYNLYLTRAQRDGRQPVAIEDEHLEAAGGAAGAGGRAGLPINPKSFDGMDQRLVRAVESLPGEYQAVLLLWAVEEFSYKEISDALEIPMGTVMSRLHRARHRLAGQLHDYAVQERIIRE